MEVIAISRSVRVAPRKVRLVADAIRKLSIPDAIESLETTNKRGGVTLLKTLKSAVANAKNNNKLEMQNLKIKTIDIGEAPAYKRFHPSTRGRIHPYKRRGSHVTIVLTDNKSEASSTKSEISSKKINVQKQLKTGKGETE